MISIEQVKFKQILISQSIIDRQGITQICELLNSHNLRSKIKLIPTCFNNECYQIKLLLLTSINTHPNKTQSREKWLICFNDEQIIPPPHIRGIVILLSQDLKSSGHSFHQHLNQFEIKSLTQALNIISLTEFQMENRIKMERMLRTSDNKYKKSKLIQNFVLIAQMLVKVNCRKNIKMLSSALTFERQRRLKLMRKYFIQWVMTHYETVINKSEDEIVKFNYLMLKSHKELKRRVFLAWKQIKAHRPLNKV